MQSVDIFGRCHTGQSQTYRAGSKRLWVSTCSYAGILQKFRFVNSIIIYTRFQQTQNSRSDLELHQNIIFRCGFRPSYHLSHERTCQFFIQPSVQIHVKLFGAVTISRQISSVLTLSQRRQITVFAQASIIMTYDRDIIQALALLRLNIQPSGMTEAVLKISRV